VPGRFLSGPRQGTSIDAAAWTTSEAQAEIKVATDSQHKHRVAPNILDRQFWPSAPNQAWGADITYLWTQQGWVYLAVVIDLYSRRVAGWSADRHMKKAFVIRALTMAINLRKPLSGLVCHSNQGGQYASDDNQKLLQRHAIVCSLCRRGNCWDNAPIERFFGSLKREWTGNCWYRTRHDAIADVREYVAVYYNAKRLHSTLGYATPNDYEKGLILLTTTERVDVGAFRRAVRPSRVRGFESLG